MDNHKMESVMKRIKEYPKYFIDDQGNVYSTIRNRYMTVSRWKGKYPHVILSSVSGPKTVDVHTLVANAFVPNPNGYPEVNHLDGNKRNNKASNLQWVTHRENHIHRCHVLNKVSVRGEQCANAVLTKKQVKRIRKQYTGAWGEQTKLAKQYGVHPGTIHSIVHDITWKE